MSAPPPDLGKLANFPAELINGVTIFDSERKMQMRDLLKRYKKAEAKVESQVENDCDPDEQHEADGTVICMLPDLLPTYDSEYVKTIYGSDLAYVCAHLSCLLEHCNLAKPYLPLNEDNLLERLSDGVLLCAMTNTLHPGTIDEAAAKTHEPMQNFNIALMSMHMYGVYFNQIERIWIGSELCALYPPGILLQIIRVLSLAKISPKDNEKLVNVFSNWKDEMLVANILSVSREEVLIRWVNYHLARVSSKICMTNFTSTLCDSIIYAHLLQAVAPAEKRQRLASVEAVSAETDHVKRAQMIVNSAEVLGMTGLIAAEHIADSTKTFKPSQSLKSQIIYTMNVAFLAQLCARYPAIEPPAGKIMDQALTETLRRPGYARGSLEETLLMWLNSFGLNSAVTYLDSDLRSGLVLLQVWETMFPKSVDWSYATIRIEDQQPPISSLCCLANCTEVVKNAVKQGISTKCTAQDILNGDLKVILPLLREMMLMHVQMKRAKYLGLKKRTKVSDTELLDFFNDQMKRQRAHFEIADINDPRLKSTTAVPFLAERLLIEDLRLMNSELVYKEELEDAKPPNEKPAGHHQKLKSAVAAVKSLLHRSKKHKRIGKIIARVSSLNEHLFDTVHSVSAKDLELNSQTAITMMRQGGMSVFTSRLGPDTDIAVYKSLLLQLTYMVC